MLKIDNNLLSDIGLSGLPDAEKNSLLKHIYETLEMRVGMRLADQMTNEQLDEFERYFEAKDDAGAFKWLESNFPNYKDIVQEEFDKLKLEVGQAAPQILAASQPAVGSAGQQAAVQAPPVTNADQQYAPQPPNPQYADPTQNPLAQPHPYPDTSQPAPSQLPPADPQGYQQEPAGYGQQSFQPPAQPVYPQQQPPANPSQ